MVIKKIKKAVAAPQVVEENGVLAFVEYVLLPASGLKRGKREFKVDRERDGLDPLVYEDIGQMHEDYRNDKVCFLFIAQPFLFPGHARDLRTDPWKCS